MKGGYDLDYFIRAASIQIGANIYDMGQGFNFEFEVTYYDSDQLPTATISIYNLSATTRAAINKNQILIINAGYHDDMGLIFLGKISSFSHKWSGMDWCTKITATSGFSEWTTKTVHKTYAQGSRASDIVRDLLNIFGIEIGICELTKNTIYPRGRICNGKLNDILQQIIVQECGSRLLIANERIIINDPTKPINQGYLLTADSGLLAVNGDEEASQTNAVGIESVKEKTWKRQCLLNYHLGIGNLIQVESRELNGKFIIMSVKHKGSATGNWMTEIELKMG